MGLGNDRLRLIPGRPAARFKELVARRPCRQVSAVLAASALVTLTSASTNARQIAVTGRQTYEATCGVLGTIEVVTNGHGPWGAWIVVSSHQVLIRYKLHFEYTPTEGPPKVVDITKPAPHNGRVDVCGFTGRTAGGTYAGTAWVSYTARRRGTQRVICSVTAVVPGDSSAAYPSGSATQPQCRFDVQYTGAGAAYFGLGVAVTSATPNPLYDATPNGLQLLVTDEAGVTYVQGTTYRDVFGADQTLTTTAEDLLVSTQPASPGTIKSFRIDYLLPTSAGNRYQGANATIVLTFETVEASNNTFEQRLHDCGVAVSRRQRLPVGLAALRVIPDYGTKRSLR